MLGTEKQQSYAQILIAQITSQLETRRAEELESLKSLKQGAIERPEKAARYTVKIERQHTYLREITLRLEWLNSQNNATCIIDNRDRLVAYLNVPFNPI